MKPLKNFNTIPLYSCHEGVWKTDTGSGVEFTKDDVKRIYIDHKNQCIIIQLKDGTKINPDFVSGMNEDTLKLKSAAWKQRILGQKVKSNHPRKLHKKYIVYGVSYWGEKVTIGETTAVSEEQAVNNVRFRRYGLETTNDPFWAEEII